MESVFFTLPQLPAPFDQIDPTSFTFGVGFSLFFAVILLLVLQMRVQRRQLTLSLKLERYEDETDILRRELKEVRHEYDLLIRECRQLETENASLQTSYRGLQQQLQEREILLEETRTQIKRDFQILAGQALQEKGESLNQQHTSTLTHLLRPFQDQILDFKSKVEDIYDRDSRDRVSMLKEIEHLKTLNQQISSEAANLTQALRGSNKLQGQWGEMILAKLLENSGLRSGKEFQTQVHHISQDGSALRPDVIVHLPDERTVIIDAKVSLKAFQDAHNTEDEQEKTLLIRQHLDSVRKQVSLLAGKQYQQLSEVGSLDFVLLFIPIEGAFQLAVEQDPELLTASMQKKVILTSPSTLLAILRTIHHLWRLDEQNRNGLVIAKQAGNLYDKFVGFAEAFEEIGFRLTQAQQSWHTARNRLSTGQGNLVARAEALKELGVQASKTLPESLSSTSSLSGEIS
nr:DNA recombination protein RmuC [uncultured Desulfobulbus sp.]